MQTEDSKDAGTLIGEIRQNLSEVTGVDTGLRTLLDKHIIVPEATEDAVENALGAIEKLALARANAKSNKNETDTDQ
jgi:hypothetical protein